MKHIYFLSRILNRLILMLCIGFITFQVKAQTTEHFTGETNGGTTFSEGGASFTLTGSYLKVVNITGYGWTGTAPDNDYVDNYYTIMPSAGIVGSIKNSTKNFYANSLYVAPGDAIPYIVNTGNIIIRGKLTGTTQYTYTLLSGNINLSAGVNNYFTFIDLSIYNAVLIDELEFEITGGLRYLAIDAFTFTVAPTVSTPTATTNTAGSITSTGATLNGNINANNASTTVTFEYGLTTGYGTSVTADQSPVTGSTATAVSKAISGLTPNSLYHFRVKGVNSAGTTNGLDQTFTSSTATPTATTSAASSITSSGATLNGNINANNSSTTVTFAYGLTTGYGTSVTADQSPVTGSTLTSVSKAISGLTPNTLYHFRVSGVNTGGTTNGADQTFTTSAGVPGIPTGVSATAGNTQVSVSFTAPANNGSAITGYTVTSNPGGLTGTGASSPVTVIGLTNGTSYTFTVTATNSVGTGSSSAASNAVTPQGSQTITFVNPGAQNYGTTPTLSATATSGLTPTFTSSTSGVCTITSGGALTFVTTGTCTINADQAGNTAYLAAPTVTRSFTVAAVVPGAPTIGTATAGDAQVSVTFSAPASNGGATITGYTVTASPGGATGTGSSSPITVTGLTNGTAYTFKVSATNSAGTGSESAASNSVTPKGSQTITFVNPGAQNYGTTLTLTATASSGLTPAFTSSTTGVCTITSGGALTFVTTGTCTINADQAGNALYLAAPTVSRSFTVAAVAPGAPTIGTATAGNTQVSVTYSAPASNGGGTITGYTVTASPGGATGTGSSSPITVTGLTNGTAYTFKVSATNSAGTSSESAASNSATPMGSQTITFANPGAQNYGTSPTLSATASSGLTPTFTSSTTGVCTITSGGALTVVTTGTCTINADQAGNTAYLAATTVSQSFPVNPVVPGAPTTVGAVAGNTLVTVSFTAPAFNGGSTITSYTATSSPGGITGTGVLSPIVVNGLTNGTSYTFTVAATNAKGTGPASSASLSVTPAAITAPGIPTGVSAIAGNAQASVSFTVPASNGGSVITGYAVTSNPSGINATGTVSPIVVSGLANGTAYTFTVTATNAIGTGAPSAASSAVTPATIPGIPTDISAIGDNGQATVSFTAPVSNGGNAITSYTATSNPAGLTGNGTSSPITVSGLTNGTAYTFTVTATNGVGTGAASTASPSVTPANIPDPPTAVIGSAGNAIVTVSFNAPVSSGGIAVTGYTVTSSPGGLTGTGASSPIDVTGLTNGTAYTFTVVATNAKGNSVASLASAAVTPFVDSEKPVISSMPANISVNTDIGKDYATVSWTAPTASDNVGVTSFAPDHVIGSQFPIGTTTVTYTATDAVGNTTTASFTVTVINNTDLASVSVSTVRLYPNPVLEWLTIENTNVIENISIFDMYGKKVLTRNVNSKKVELNIELLREGTYLIRIANGDHVNFCKLIKL